MHLYISALFVRNRATGEVQPLPLAGNPLGIAFAGSVAPGKTPAAIPAAHETLRAGTPDGEALREKYSEALLVIDNVPRNSYSFASAAADEAAKVAQDLTKARSAAAASETAVAAARKASSNLTAAEATHKINTNRVATLEARLAALKSPTSAQPAASAGGGAATPPASNALPEIPGGKVVETVPPQPPAAPAPAVNTGAAASTATAGAESGASATGSTATAGEGGANGSTGEAGATGSTAGDAGAAAAAAPADAGASAGPASVADAVKKAAKPAAK